MIRPVADLRVRRLPGPKAGAKRGVGRAGGMPGWVEPMMALLAGAVPGHSHEWAFEFKWDGIRALSFFDGRGGLKILSRNGNDATFRYPELAGLGKGLGGRSVILDGEIIAVDREGRPSFPTLAKRMHVTRAEAVERMAREVPVQYVLFDCLWLDGEDLRGLGFSERRERLESLKGVLPEAYRLSPVRVGRGADMLAVATERGLEGIVAKRLTSVYEAGERSGAWLKIKIVQRQEMVVGGWVPEVSGSGEVRRDQVGSLVLGYYDGEGRLRHAGSVGTGFTEESSREMVKRLRKLETGENPFGVELAVGRWGRKKATRWVRPEVVVEVEYRRWPEGGMMHQTAFKGVREDKKARDVVREEPVAASRMNDECRNDDGGNGSPPPTTETRRDEETKRRWTTKRD
ncbi:MAG: non-homologous end-joining DNA ligase [Phycisphaerae bacterium]